VEVFERNKKLAREQEQQEEEDDYVDFSNDNDDEEVEVEKVQPQVQQAPVQQVAKPQPQQEVAKPQQVVKEEPKKELNERLDELKEEVRTNTEKFKFEKEQRTHRKIEVEDEAVISGEEVEVEEIEDYKNKGSIKPKKMSTSIIIMGIGIGLLTWGAVNFFRERR